jgi:hypothetical protein
MLSDMGKGVLFFTLFGPPLGGLSLTVVMLLIELGQGQRIAADDLWVLLLIPLIAYPFGAIPAALTGLVLGTIRDRLLGWRGAVFGGGIGYIITFALLQLMEPSKAIDPGYLPFALVGLAPAAILSPLFAKRWSERATRDRENRPAADGIESNTSTASSQA